MDEEKHRNPRIGPDDSVGGEGSARDDFNREEHIRMENSASFEPKEEKKVQPLQGQGSMLTGAGNIEKIRDILFGSQMRDYEKRFARLEDRMQKEVNGLKDDLRKHFETLESFIKRELELVNERLQKEQNDRYAAAKELSQELKETSTGLERRIVETEDLINRKVRDLHDQLLAQSKNLSDDIHQRCQTISVALEKEAQELREDKVDRANLSELLMEMALRVNKNPVDFDAAANELLDE